MAEKMLMLPLGYNRDDYLRKGQVYRIEIPLIKVQQFAMIILSLTNMKSSGSIDIVDIRTYEGCNTIRVIFEGERTDIPERYLSGVVQDSLNYEDKAYEIIHDGPIEIVEISSFNIEKPLVDDPYNIIIKEAR